MSLHGETRHHERRELKRYNKRTVRRLLLTIIACALIYVVNSLFLDTSKKSPASSTPPTRLARAGSRANHDLKVVTATSANHFKSLLYFIDTLRQHEPKVWLIVYDLGLSNCQHRYLDPIALDHDSGVDELRLFNFAEYPPHFNITVATGEYAWKPAIIKTVVDQFEAPVLWLDSGNYFLRDLEPARARLKQDGFYTTPSAGTVQDWVHHGMLERFGAIDGRHNMRSNCNGAVVGFHKHPTYSKDGVQQGAYELLLQPWFDCAMEKHCIAPPGSSRENHRQDQAALTVIAYNAGLPYACQCGRDHSSVANLARTRGAAHKGVTEETCDEAPRKHLFDGRWYEGIGQWSDNLVASIKGPC